MCRILIVEDHINFRQAFKDLLSDQFPSTVIEEAGEGKEALQKVEAFHPHLIFMDIQLPGVNGLELTKKIKAIYPHIAIMIMTSYDVPEYRETALKSGASYFFSKTSLNEEELFKPVKSLSSELGIDLK